MLLDNRQAGGYEIMHLKLTICEGKIHFDELEELLPPIREKGYPVFLADNGNIIIETEEQKQEIEK